MIEIDRILEIEYLHEMCERHESGAKFFVEFISKLIYQFGEERLKQALENSKFKVQTNGLQIDFTKHGVIYENIYPEFKSRKSFPVVLKLKGNHFFSEIKNIQTATKKSLVEYQLVSINGVQYIITNQISLKDRTKDWDKIHSLVNELRMFVNKEKNETEVTIQQSIYKRNDVVINELREKINENSFCSICKIKYDSKVEEGFVKFNVHFHHLIPLSMEPDYNVRRTDLDVVENIIDICPNCHSLIHFFDSQDDSLRKLASNKLGQNSKIYKKYYGK